MSSYEFYLSDVTFTNGSDVAQINNSDSVFGALPGSSIFINGESLPQTLISVDDNERTITLSKPWTGNNISQIAVKITPMGSISTMLTAIDTMKTLIERADELVSIDAVNQLNGLVEFVGEMSGTLANTISNNVSDMVQFVTPEMFGGLVGEEDSTLSIQAAVDFCRTSNIRLIKLRGGTWRSSFIKKTFRGLTIEGVGSGRPGSEADSGTRLSWIGVGDTFIMNGDPDEQPWDANLYFGPQALTLRNLNIHNGSETRTEPLNCTTSFYTLNSKAIADWRGGHIEIDDVFIEGFHWTIWGINSDFNKYKNLTQAYCKRGLYFGPRSDQSVVDGFYSFYCDTVAVIDRSSDHKFKNTQIVVCGSTQDYTVQIYKGSSNITFEQPWLENYVGVTDCLPFFDVGSEDGYNANTDAPLGVWINNPTVAVQIAGASGPNELISVSKGERIKLTEVVGSRGTTITSNLATYFVIPQGVTATGIHLVYSGQPTDKVLLSHGIGKPKLIANKSGNEHIFSSQTGRLSIEAFGAALGANKLRFSQKGTPGRLSIEAPDYSDGSTDRLDLFRSITQGTSMPTSGRRQPGDYHMNIAPVLLGGTGSRYVIRGWKRLTEGESHVKNVDWLEEFDVLDNPLSDGSRWTLTSSTGRLTLQDIDASLGADKLTISQENLPGRILFSTENLPIGQINRLDFRRVIRDDIAKPASGYYQKGDYVRNIEPSVKTDGGINYIVRGWLRLRDGSEHALDIDWFEDVAISIDSLVAALS